MLWSSATPIAILQAMLSGMHPQQKNIAVLHLNEKLNKVATGPFRKAAELARDLLLLEHMSLTNDGLHWIEKGLDLYSIKQKLNTLTNMSADRKIAMYTIDDATLETFCMRMSQLDTIRKTEARSSRNRSRSSSRDKEKDASLLEINTIQQKNSRARRYRSSERGEDHRGSYRESNRSSRDQRDNREYDRQSNSQQQHMERQDEKDDFQTKFLARDCTRCPGRKPHSIKDCYVTFPHKATPENIRTFFEMREAKFAKGGKGNRGRGAFTKYRGNSRGKQ